MDALRRPDLPALCRRDLFRSPRSLRRVRFPTIFLKMAAYGAGGGEVDRFELSPSSVIKIRKGDITEWFVDGSTDAIVSLKNASSSLRVLGRM